MRGACSNACKLLGRNCDSSRLSTTTATRPILGTSANCFTKIFVRIYEDILLLDREIRVSKIAGYFFFFFFFRKKANYTSVRDTRVVEIIGVIMGVVGTMSGIIRDTSA